MKMFSSIIRFWSYSFQHVLVSLSETSEFQVISSILRINMLLLSSGSLFSYSVHSTNQNSKFTVKRAAKHVIEMHEKL